MAQTNGTQKKGPLNGWLLPIILLIFFPPAGFFAVIVKLLSSNVSRGSHPCSTQHSAQNSNLGARTTAGTAQQASRPDTGAARGGRPLAGAALNSRRDKIMRTLDRKGRTMAIAGGAVAAVFALGGLSMFGEAMGWLVDGHVNWFLEDLFELLPVLVLAFGGGGFLWAGLHRRKQIRRFRQYLAMIGNQKVISLSTLASASGVSADKVRDDLEDMFNAQLFPSGFLDYGGDRLVLSGDGIHEEAPKAKAEPVKKSEGDSVLAEIRAVNDAIQNKKLSREIDRIGEITAKIFDYQRSHPEKSPQLHSFLSYYLPTTLRILRAYAQLESQGIEGANITAAKERIENMMDKVVEGFEKQLDQLFQGEAMDISADVQVLEQMLSKDGLSSRDGIQLSL